MVDLIFLQDSFDNNVKNLRHVNALVDAQTMLPLLSSDKQIEGRRAILALSQALVFRSKVNKTINDIAYANEYHPHEIGHVWSSQILALKNTKQSAVDFFFNMIDPLLYKGISLAIVPSSTVNKTDTGTARLVAQLAAAGRENIAPVLVRTVSIPKAHQGGPRSVELHRQTMRIDYPDLVNGKVVVLIDDVSTTGSSLIAAREKLIEAGASQVECFALAQTCPIWVLDTRQLLTLMRVPKIKHAALHCITSLVIKPPNTLKEMAEQLDRHWPEIYALNHRIRKVPPTLAELLPAYEKAEQTIEKARQEGNTIIGFNDSAFPAQLRGIPSPPPVLFVKGNIDILSQTAVAIIGTREPTDFGVRCARRFGERFAENGFVVVSGLALGCDTAGHEGSLTAGGQTIAFMAHGLDMVYPLENTKLADRILAQGGALVSEYEIGIKPTDYSFPARDRLQSGFARAVVVVETDIKGGTMITVGHAKQQGRLLACLSHPEIYKSDKSRGNETLINEGAIALRNAEGLDRLMNRLVGVTTPQVSYKGIIFDLDQTLVDSQISATLRTERKWSDVYPLIPSFSLFDGVREILDGLVSSYIPVCIVTSSPKSYANQVIEYFKLPIRYLVCYHDTQEHKPHPAPIQAGLKKLNQSAADVLSIGDDIKDAQASQAAGVRFISAMWGASDPVTLHAVMSEARAATVNDLRILLNL